MIEGKKLTVHNEKYVYVVGLYSQLWPLKLNPLGLKKKLWPRENLTYVAWRKEDLSTPLTLKNVIIRLMQIYST